MGLYYEYIELVQLGRSIFGRIRRILPTLVPMRDDIILGRRVCCFSSPIGGMEAFTIPKRQKIDAFIALRSTGMARIYIE